MFKAGTKLLRFLQSCAPPPTPQKAKCHKSVSWLRTEENLWQFSTRQDLKVTSDVEYCWFKLLILFSGATLNISPFSSWIMWLSYNNSSFHHIHNPVSSTGLWFAVELLLALHLGHTQCLRLHECMKRWQIPTSGNRTSGVFSASVFECGVTLTCMAALFAWPHTAHAFGFTNGS